LIEENRKNLMVSCKYDLKFLRAGVSQLEKYLIADNIFWPLDIQAAAGEPPYPQLTLGWLLLFRTRASSSCEGEDTHLEREQIAQEINSTRAKWLLAWKNKARAEFHARLNLWRDFLEEYRINPRDNYARYSYEVSRLVCLNLLWAEAGEIRESDIQVFNMLDSVLRGRFVPGKFIWDDKIAPSFPKTNYWYLYGSLSREAETGY
jgi:hypothetical protein